MNIELAIKKLKTSNQGLESILNNVHEQLGDITSDPRMKNLSIDLQNLFESYLDVWMKNNSEIIELLETENNHD